MRVCVTHLHAINGDIMILRDLSYTYPYHGLIIMVYILCTLYHDVLYGDMCEDAPIPWGYNGH